MSKLQSELHRRVSRSLRGAQGARRPAAALLAPLLLLLWAPALAPAARADATARAVPPAAPTALVRALDRVLDQRSLRGARIGVLVQAADGRALYARDPDRRLTPASNVKIFTAVAALSSLGPTHRFETLVLSDAPPDADGAVATLVLRGGGDPAVNSEDWWQLADELRRRGLRRVRGDLVLDDSLFDRERWHPSWGRVSSRSYHAPVGALNANYGAFVVGVEPSADEGRPPQVQVAPPVAHLRIVNRASTSRARARTQLRVDRQRGPDGELVVVSGSIGADEEVVTFHRSVGDPARYAGSLFRLQLEGQGIAVDGEVRLAAGVHGQVSEGAGAEPAAPHVLLRHSGRSLAEIVRLCMKYSNNQIAEALVKTLATRAGTPRGSWRAGGEEMRRVLVDLGVAADGFALVDGSGLSYENEASPRALVQALRVAEGSFEFGPELLASLPLADRDGTLANRAAGAAGAVRAKTGTLTRVTALSGVARLAGGERALFSILVNGYRSGDRDAMNAVDDFVTALVTTPRVAAGAGPARPR